MIQRIASKSPETPVNTISGGLYALVTDEAERIIRLSRGVYILKKNEENSTLSEANPDQLDAKNIDVVTADGTKTVSEDTFYAPFAEWLKGEGEASQTVKLGGNILKGKWGTSDVIGVLKPLKADPIQFPIEIVFAEIKLTLISLSSLLDRPSLIDCFRTSLILLCLKPLHRTIWIGSRRYPLFMAWA